VGTTGQVSVGDAHLEVEVSGTGEPVVLIPTALVADELRPLAGQPSVRERYRTVQYRRRGYAGSSPAVRPGSVVREAGDCRALLDALGEGPAHVVGVSYSGAVALQLAAEAPDYVHSLTLIEPPPVHVLSAPEFRAANARLIATYDRNGAEAALEEFLTLLDGPDWRQVMEGLLPGSVEQMERDAATFFGTDLPALLAWDFSAERAGRVECPVLYVGGSLSGRWFAEVRELMLAWLPRAEDVVIDGADHSVALTHPAALAAAVSDFLTRHPRG